MCYNRRMKNSKWRYFEAGRLVQVRVETADDVANLKDLDRKLWTVLSCATRGLRFDPRTLELLDATGKGRIDQSEVLAAVDWLVGKGVDLNELFVENPAAEKRLAAVMAQQADLAKAPLNDADKAAADAWAKRPEQDAAILPLGDKTEAANAALASVEAAIDGFFAVPDDLPLVTEEPDKELPLASNLNPKWQAGVRALVAQAVEPLLGAKTALTRCDWETLKAKFAPYRAWLAAKPVAAAATKAALEDEERLLRYKLHLGEFLQNYVNQARLYGRGTPAIYQTGTLYLDGRAFSLCFDVADEGAHAALAEKSKCCLVYAKLTSKKTGAARTVCAVVTAGKTAPLYAGRNGLFFDRDNGAWDATVTRVVEAQVSLTEAFWAPWAKLFGGVSAACKKFLSAKQEKATAGVSGALQKVPAAPAAAPAPNNGAAMASSVAAIGIGVGMVGAAFAGLMSAISGMPWWHVLVGLAGVVLAVSLPSVILAWFKLRARDLGAILNACGWAVNVPLRLSARLAREFTTTAKTPFMI